MMSAGTTSFKLDTIRAVQGFQVMRQGANILLAILLAKSGLSLDDIGLYEMLMYIGTTISFFWVTGTLQSLLTLYPVQDTAEKRRLIFTAYLFFGAMALISGMLMLSGMDVIREYLAGGARLDYFPLFTIYLVINLPTYLLEHFLQLRNRPLRILGFGLLSFGGQVLVVILPIFLGWGLRWSFLGLIGLACLKHLWLLVFVLREGIPGFDRVQFREWMWLALPLGGYALMGGFSTAFDGWLVNWTYDGDETLFATWRYGARELPLSLALVSGLSTGLLPGVSKQIASGLEEVKKRSLRLQHLLFPLSIALMATSWWWFPRVFNPGFAAAVPVFNLFLLIIISRLVLSRTVMMGLKENAPILWVSVVELAINVGLSLWLVRYMGLSGIALGTVIAYTFEKVAYGIWLHWKHGIHPGRYVHLGWLAGYSAALLTVWWIML